MQVHICLLRFLLCSGCCSWFQITCVEKKIHHADDNGKLLYYLALFLAYQTMFSVSYLNLHSSLTSAVLSYAIYSSDDAFESRLQRARRCYQLPHGLWSCRASIFHHISRLFSQQEMVHGKGVGARRREKEVEVEEDFATCLILTFEWSFKFYHFHWYH